MNPTGVQAFPLKWPNNVPRTPSYQVKASAFGKVNWNREMKAVEREVKLLNGNYLTISTNQELRQDGRPYAQQKPMSDAGVAVYFTVNAEQVCFPCDRYRTMNENLRAIVKHLEAMRGQARWGVGTAKQAFGGYKALTATSGKDESWWIVLGVLKTATVDHVKVAHREAAQRAHPDRGGSANQMARINTARDRALAEIA